MVLGKPFSSLGKYNGSMSYLKIASSVYDLKYQLVCVAKYHKAILYRAISLLVRKLMEKIRASPDSCIEKGHVSKEHLHFLALITPNLPLSEFATRLKRRSIHMKLQEFDELPRAFWE